MPCFYGDIDHLNNIWNNYQYSAIPNFYDLEENVHI